MPRIEPFIAENRLRYPPVDPGIPMGAVDDLLHAHDDLIRRIKLAYGTDAATFTSELMVLIQRYAQYVNQLPATPDNYFSGPGGLLRMGLEIAFFALQATDGQIFSGRSTITSRRQLEPRWRHATFIAGLCSEIHRTLSHLHVTDEAGCAWPAYLMPLTQWLEERRAQRFFLRWNQAAQETRSLGVFALPQIVPSDMLQHLAQGNEIVVPHMLASISGMPVYRDHNVLDQLVQHAAALVIDRDLQASADRYGKPQLGAHLERYLIDALRRLVQANNGWTPNADKSRVWYGEDGVFIVWPNAVQEMARLLDSDQLPGIPKSPDTILDVLIDAGVLLARDAASATWTIYPGQDNAPIEAVKLATPAILFATLANPPLPFPYPLTKPRAQPAAATNATTAASKGKVKRAQTAVQLPLPGTVVQDSPPSPMAEQNSSSPDVTPPSPQPLESAEGWGRPRFSLAAPIRLNPALRSALEAVVETMNGNDHGPLACRTVSTGLFVPLEELERRHIDPALAIRALDELSMLAGHATDKLKTALHDFGGEKKPGIVIAPRFIAGVDPRDFIAGDTPLGEHDARA